MAITGFPDVNLKSEGSGDLEVQLQEANNHRVDEIVEEVTKSVRNEMKNQNERLHQLFSKEL